MAKRIRAILCALLAACFLLSVSFGEEPFSAGDPGAAFSGGGKLRLIRTGCPAALPDELNDPAALAEVFLGLSPDGKTILSFTNEEIPLEAEETGTDPEEGAEPVQVKSEVQTSLPGRKRREIPTTRTVSHFRLVRDGETIPVAEVPEAGDGDPYRKFEQMMAASFRAFPGTEGLSWSEDGRYVTFSNIGYAFAHNITSQCVPVIDTERRQAWAAHSYANQSFSEGIGWTYLCRMSRDGRYVYDLSVESVDEGTFLCFCRGTVEGGNREILCRTPYRSSSGYSLTNASNLFEAADGSWLLSAVSGDGTNTLDRIALVRFRPSGDGWTADIRPTLIPRLLMSTRFTYSAAAGYGLMTLVNPEAERIADEAVMVSGSVSTEIRMISRHVNLVRFYPEGPAQNDVWYMRRTGESCEDMKMVSAAEHLAFVQLLVLGIEPVKPEGFDVGEAVRNPDPVIHNVWYSPDGRYALLAVETNLPDVKGLRLYLLDPETMEVRYVEAPEGAAGMNLSASLTDGSQTPGLSWNPDGTIVIRAEDGTYGFFRLAVE